jgi:hypothetical protein
MIEPDDSQPAARSVSPGTKAWIARRNAMRQAATADSADAAARSAARDRRLETEDNSRAPVWIGFAVVIIVLVVCLAIIGMMRCDPLYSDLGLSRRSACQE